MYPICHLVEIASTREIQGRETPFFSWSISFPEDIICVTEQSISAWLSASFAEGSASCVSVEMLGPSPFCCCFQPFLLLCAPHHSRSYFCLIAFSSRPSKLFCIFIKCWRTIFKNFLYHSCYFY